MQPRGPPPQGSQLCRIGGGQDHASWSSGQARRGSAWRARSRASSSSRWTGRTGGTRLRWQSYSATWPTPARWTSSWARSCTRKCATSTWRRRAAPQAGSGTFQSPPQPGPRVCLDKTSLVLMANNEIMLDQLEAGNYERAKDVVAWYINAAKTYGVKAVNPGGVAAWKWGEDAKQVTSPIAGYNNLTPGKIVAELTRICNDMGLPHPMHLHCNNLGAPGNITTTMETLKHLEGQRAHIAHSQFHAYGGNDWEEMRSEAAQLAEFFNANPDISTDAGAVVFGETVTISADGPWQHLLYELTGHKWGNLDVENETGCGIVPYNYKRTNVVNAVQWAVGLELMLLINNPWQVSLSTDHPNGGCFWRYPEIIHLLMNADFRKECISKLPDNVKSRITLPEIDREYSLYEVATLISAGPARTLGLNHKGNLGIGCDGDIAVYEEEADVTKMFSYPRYVIKGGEVVIEEGHVRSAPQGREVIVQPEHNPDTNDFIRPLFEDCYTMSFENYPVEMERVENPVTRECEPV
ncbi:MAG: formylmethanofuran dehydrogenase subunit A [Planctomycetaceae bacterium]|nr:formylmethanofuran dehydrogenase subunit A [Planctomycetaceae bacterium]